MKKLISIAILSIFSFSLYAQVVRHELVFKEGQIRLSAEQMEEIRKLPAKHLSERQFNIYPVTYNEAFGRYEYASIAAKQALEIAEYAKTVGFEFKKISRNFPSAHNGFSVCVNLRLKKQYNTKAFDFFPDKESQFFVIDPTKDTVLVGNEGTKLHFDAACLNTAKKVKVELKEYYSLGEYIIYNMPTVSNGQMIQTGGVIYLNASEEADPNKKVSINPQKGVGVEFANNNDPDMQMFVQDPRSRNELNWVLPNEQIRDWRMTLTMLDENNNVISQRVFYSEEEWNNYKNQRNQGAETNEKAQSLLRINNFGLLNCDKYIDVRKAPLVYKADPDFYAKYYLVFTDTRGMLPGEDMLNTVQFKGVPANAEASLVAIAYKDEQPYYFSKKINTNGNTAFDVKLTAVSKEFINQQLGTMK